MEWINVKDKLPKDSTKVICQSAHKIIYVAWYIDDDQEFFPYAHSAADMPIGIVTHWMPQPETQGE
jgi:hypothetical protein